MIFTDKFVYVHEPKTGGTFVTSMLFRLYGLRWTRWTHVRNALFGQVGSKHPRYGYLAHNSNKHGGCNEIPQQQRGKKISPPCAILSIFTCRSTSLAGGSEASS